MYDEQSVYIDLRLYEVSSTFSGKVFDALYLTQLCDTSSSGLTTVLFANWRTVGL
jgi:hypothetical protein